MAVKTINVLPSAVIAHECLTLELGATATSQTDLEKDSVVVGFPFQVVRVEVYAKTVTATIALMVRKGSTNILSGAVTPVADTPTAGTLSTTLATIRGSATDDLNVIYTSNGTGQAVNARVRVWVRPIPMNGEAVS